MRVLFARVGIPYSPFTGKPIRSQPISEMVDKIKKLPKNNTIYLLSPIVRGRKGEYKKEILNYKKRGFSKIKVDGKYLNIDEFPNFFRTLLSSFAISFSAFSQLTLIKGSIPRKLFLLPGPSSNQLLRNIG